MRLDRRFLLVAAGSMIWALAVAVIFYRVAGGQRSRPRAESPEKPMVIAAQPLPMGSNLSRENVKLRNVPEALFPSGGFSRLEDVLGRPVISPIQADEPVVEARIAAQGSGVGLAPLIPDGMRAISVRVNDVVGVAGFILPGMRVDVLVTGRPPRGADIMTRTVLQNVTVLSAGQTLQTDGKSPAINTPVVTLLVTPEDAEALTLSNAEGHIQLVLRNTADQQVTGTRGRQLHDLYGAATVAEAAPPAPKTHKTAAIAATRPAPEPVVKAPDPSPVRAVELPKPPPEQVLLIRGNVKTTEPAIPKTGDAK
jgi:pilus assembly protein CpaB